MSHINTCIRYKGIEHWGELHPRDLHFDYMEPNPHADICDFVSAKQLVIANRSRLGLIPLTKSNKEMMAVYLINRRNVLEDDAVIEALVDFDELKLFSTPDIKHKSKLDEHTGIFEHKTISRQELKGMIQDPRLSLG